MFVEDVGYLQPSRLQARADALRPSADVAAEHLGPDVRAVTHDPEVETLEAEHRNERECVHVLEQRKAVVGTCELEPLLRHRLDSRYSM
jgi:hypothetical protein